MSVFARVFLGWLCSLLCVPGHERQIQDERHPVSVDQEQESQKSVYGGFGDDVGVETVAEIDRVDVVTAAPLACARRLCRMRHRRSTPTLGDQNPLPF
jgi:hypothetical protein